MIDRSLNPTAGAHRVLVACSDPAGSDYFRSVLESRGFRVDVALGAEEAQSRIGALCPNVVLSDVLREAGEDEIEAHGRIVTRGVECGAPVIVLAEANQFSVASDLLERGATDCVTKPLSSDELLRRIAIVLLKQNTAQGERRETVSPAVHQRPSPSMRSDRGREVRRPPSEPAFEW